MAAAAIVPPFDEDEYLQQLASAGTRSLACQVLGLSESQVARHMRQDPAFRARADLIYRVMRDRLATSTFKRAVDGVEERVIECVEERMWEELDGKTGKKVLIKTRRFECVGVRRKYDAARERFQLAAHIPELYSAAAIERRGLAPTEDEAEKQSVATTMRDLSPEGRIALRKVLSELKGPRTPSE